MVKEQVLVQETTEIKEVKLSEQEIVRREKLQNIENAYPERYEINYELHEAAELEAAIIKNSEDFLLFTDDYSGVLMDHLWERVQRDYDEIIQTKEE